MTRLTLRRLRAMEAALNSMLSGAEGEGDWPEDISWRDTEGALDWVWQQIDRREAPSHDFPPASKGEPHG